jgi:hypothetical protein
MVTPTPPADSPADPVADLPADLPADPIAAPAPPGPEPPLSAFAELDPVHPAPPMSPAAAPLAAAARSASMLSAVGPVSGIFFVALFLLSFMVMSTPSGDASDREWTSYWEDSGNRTQGITSALAMLLAAIAFLWLVAALRRRLAGALGTDAFYASGIAAGALMFVASLGAGLVPLGYELADTPIPDDADLLRIVDGLYFGTVFLPLPYALAGFLIPLFFALRGSLLVPRWLEWATLVVGILALAGPMLFFVPHALFLLWTLAMSVTLLVRERPA